MRRTHIQMKSAEINSYHSNISSQVKGENEIDHFNPENCNAFGKPDPTKLCCTYRSYFEF